jgi:hypothetical protein
MNWKRGISTTASVMLALMLGVGLAEARPRVAFLTRGDQQMDAVYRVAFIEGLRRLGYVDAAQDPWGGIAGRGKSRDKTLLGHNQ